MKEKFSAFRLFYDEFIYKNNLMVDYAGIEDNVVRIREIAREMRNTFPDSKYMSLLDNARKELKNELDTIYEKSPSFYASYLSVYKKHVSFGTDTEKEMPFVIATSFYNDYRVDDKGSLDYSILIPRYTSLEKKEIRDYYKANGLLELFLYLLKKCSGNYGVLVTRIEYLKDLTVAYNETAEDFKKRFDGVVADINDLLVKCEDKSKKSMDYLNIKDAVALVYKNKYDNWVSLLKDEFYNLFKNIYEKDRKSKAVLYYEVDTNSISFETFEKYCSELVLEKERILEEVTNGEKPVIDVPKKAYCADFRKKLLEEYFDSRLYFTLNEDDSVEKVADIGYKLGLFVEDLINRVFEKDKFDAAFSRSLSRNNDVKSAIIRKLYELYDPTYLISIYEKQRKSYIKFVSSKGKEFASQVDYFNERIQKSSGLKSLLLTEDRIIKELVIKRINFVKENLEDIVSQDIFEYYDTRNYDLEIILNRIDTKNLVTLYPDLKKRINNNEFSVISCISGEYSDKKNDMLYGLLHVFVRVIASKEYSLDLESDRRLRQKVFKKVALEFLDERIYEDVKEEDYRKNNSTFMMTRELFSIDSNYSKLKKMI